ncbi:hypothetical protein E0Z10_g3206 [Xylaria hypoxylon]|uniref:Uncharacterized protein n=1 Tax=Xylaria hypoxylon TaxID=37992 RepID=A0A4Z0Z866_9PEZI|nr:hypothetical protein E0Z10_g3206 [Xylaria hypoxylon]
MSTLTPPVSIVLVGIHTEIGGPVAEGLRPDWDIVRFIQTFEEAQSDLPYILRGEAPPTAPSNSVGSEDYSRPVRAILFGRGFTQQQAETLYGLYSSEAKVPVLWGAGAAANRGPGTEPPPGVEKVMVPIFRGLLENWKKEVERKGEGEAKKGDLVLY